MQITTAHSTNTNRISPRTSIGAMSVADGSNAQRVRHEHLDASDGSLAMAWRGILAGLWLTCTTVILIALLPGIGIGLGNLPGDFHAGSAGGGVELPIASITLIIVTLSGLCFRISSLLSRH